MGHMLCYEISASLFLLHHNIFLSTAFAATIPKVGSSGSETHPGGICHMRVNRLVIRNFRGIQLVDTGILGDTIVIAGQNGSGKSCIFDAIRLLKSTYGGYQQNEWQNFFGEFAIQLQGGLQNMVGLFNKMDREIAITAEFQLSERERKYISENAAFLLSETIWQQILPEAFQWGGFQRALFAAQFRARKPEVDARVAQALSSLLTELSESRIMGEVTVSVTGDIKIRPSNLLSVAFTNYRPREIGVIDYHGPQRHYGRENVQGINLSLDQARQTYSQHTLYNYNNKYNNVKSEMAGNYIKEILAERAGGRSEDGNEKSLLDTMKELFESFFPDKEFLGPEPTVDGSLSFPVRTKSGNRHDLDELSSGEKEILYGYLRIRSSAPRDSIILLDEPELHLNPRLIRGLPDFYRRHLGEALGNQLWLVTHSDALIREAVGKPGFNVFHMLPCGQDIDSSSQLKPLTVTGDIDLVLADLVGDLASYRPGGKGVIFEGGGDSDFDKTFVSTLFSQELRGVNLISGTNKARVKALHEILNRAHRQGDLPTKFYAITDKDTEDEDDLGEAVNQFTWDVYHIENYLLDVSIITEVIRSLKVGSEVLELQVAAWLEDAARDVVPVVLVHRMRAWVNSHIVRCIDLGFAPDTATIGRDLSSAVVRSAGRVTKVVTDSLSEDSIVAHEQRLRAEVNLSIADGSWRAKLPGREILKKFIQIAEVPVKYEIFRNLLLSKMADKNLKPQGMAEIIGRICAD